MICITQKIDKIKDISPQAVKINCIYELYNDVALFWEQDNNKAVICMLDGNMVVYNNDADIDELREFINVISPTSVFSDAETMEKLFDNNFHRVCVMKSTQNFSSDVISDELNSKEIYSLLDVNGIELPPYEYFAVDFCHRLNSGRLKYFALNKTCVAVTITDGQAVLLNGIASHKKGMGSVALRGVLSQESLPCMAVCEQAVKPFYLKNNFIYACDAGYWRKNF